MKLVLRIKDGERASPAGGARDKMIRERWASDHSQSDALKMAQVGTRGSVDLSLPDFNLSKLEGARDIWVGRTHLSTMSWILAIFSLIDAASLFGHSHLKMDRD